MTDPSFTVDADGLRAALAMLLDRRRGAPDHALPDALPESGLGDREALSRLAPLVLGGAARLGSETAFAHMDPPTPWVSWAATLWNAALNQNLLHPDVAPVARDLETLVVNWLAPSFGMLGGHMTAGSTLANITALWAARDLRGVTSVAASNAAHLLGLKHVAVATDARGRIEPSGLPRDLGRTALVLTAGTTGAGAIDDMTHAQRMAAWVHVDAAWAGPLRLTPAHAHRLSGIEHADSVAVSAHKWLFQPKESALVLFKDVEAAHRALSFGGGYLRAPNIGIQGSHGAMAIPLLATLLAWGRAGLADRIDRSMANAETLWRRLDAHPNAVLFGANDSGVVPWRPADRREPRAVLAALPVGSTSLTTLDGQDWLRNVAANPSVDIDRVWRAISAALDA